MSRPITSHSSHCSSCSLGFTIFILLYIWILLFTIQLLVFIYVLFIRNCASLRVIFIFLKSGFSSSDWCYWKINRNSCHGWKGLWYIYTHIYHFIIQLTCLYFLRLLINIFVSFLYPCVSWVECFSTYDEINCSFFSGSLSIHWPNF